jgi:hypothetical protein
MSEQMTLEEFGKKIKGKYPQYANIPDADLANKIIAKHPQYKSSIRPGAVSRFVEGVKHTTIDPIKDLWNIHSQNVKKHGPITGGLATLRDVAKGMYEAPHQYFNQAMESASKGDVSGTIRNVEGSIPIIGPSLVEGASEMDKGNYSGAVGQATGLVAATKAPGIAKKGLNKVGELRAKVIPQMQKRAAGFITKTGAEEVTRPMIKKYLEKLEIAQDKQNLVDAATEAENKRVSAEAVKKTADQDAIHRGKVADQEKNYQAAVKKTGKEYEQKVSDVERSNEERAGIEQKKQTLQQSKKLESENLGREIKESDAQLRSEGNQLYSVVEEAVENDEGVPATNLIEAVKYAKESLIEGKKESVPQFSEILQRQPQATKAMQDTAAYLEISPEQLATDPKFSNILNKLQQGGRTEAQNIKFKDLKGYSSELGAKIAQGPKPGQGDLYRAYKYVKQAIDEAKKFIAVKNGVSEALDTADKFWSQYMDAFYDKDSAVAKIRKSVGVIDPEYYSSPLVTGKSAKTGVGKLRNIQSQYTVRLNNLADRAEAMGRSNEELKGLPTATQERQALPEEPRPIESPQAIKPPAPVEPKLKTAPEIAKPRAITAKKIMSEKEERVRAKASEIGSGRRFTIQKILAAPVRGTVDAIATMIAGRSLTKPAVIEYLIRFTKEDLVYVESLPDPQKTTLKNNIIALMKEQSNGKNPIAPNPYLQKALGVSGLMAVSKKQPIQNRKEALERLKQAQ